MENIKYIQKVLPLKDGQIDSDLDINKLRGWVDLYSGDGSGNPVEKLNSDHNLIVYDSREIILEKVFGLDRVTGTGESDLSIGWISLGTGGADVANPSNPINPSLSDSSLNTEIEIDGANGDYDSVDGLNGNRKPIGSYEFLTDTKNSNRYLIMKTTTIITRTEANGNNLNEAALWFADSKTATEVTKYVMAARATFPTTYKTSVLELILVWYWFI